MRRYANCLRLDKREEGLSLVELVVYVVLLGIVGLITTTLVLNVLRVNSSVARTSNASNGAQAYLDSVESSVRNATTIWSTGYPDGSSLLLTQTRSTSSSDGTEAQYCRAFFYDATAKSLLRMQSTPAINGVTWTLPSTVASARSLAWVPQVKDVTRIESMHVLASSGATVSISFEVAAGAQAKPVQFSTVTRVLMPGSAEGVCFK